MTEVGQLEVLIFSRTTFPLLFKSEKLYSVTVCLKGRISSPVLGFQLGRPMLKKY